jgi:hypothetical protein
MLNKHMPEIDNEFSGGTRLENRSVAKQGLEQMMAGLCLDAFRNRRRGALESSVRKLGTRKTETMDPPAATSNALLLNAGSGGGQIRIKLKVVKE